MERQYAQQLQEWSNKWKPVVDSSKFRGRGSRGGERLALTSLWTRLSHPALCLCLCLAPPPSGPLYGSLMRAWQCFLSSADRLASLHASICRSLVSEDGDRVRTWQKDTFHKKLFGGFKESQDIETGFIRAQKPWAKRLKKVGLCAIKKSRTLGGRGIMLMITCSVRKH